MKSVFTYILISCVVYTIYFAICWLLFTIMSNDMDDPHMIWTLSFLIAAILSTITGIYLIFSRLFK